MRFVLCLLSLWILTSAISGLRAEEPTLPPEGQAVVDRYVAEGAKLQQDAEVKRQAARTKLVTALETIQASEAKAGHLDAAVAVKKLHDGLQADPASDPGKVAPDPQWPKGVARQLDSYQNDNAKIDKELAPKVTAVREQAVRDLEAIKIAQTKAGKLDAALAVRQTQEQLRSGQAAAGKKGSTLSRAFVFGAGIGLEPTDGALLRRGGAASTLEFMVATVTKDGLLFKCGAGGNGQSVAVMGDEIWYAVAHPRHGTMLKAPLNGTKPPFHLAVTFKDGDVAIWVNGALAKKESAGIDAIGDNGMGGGVGDLASNSSVNQPGMPRQGFEGSLAAFRYVDKALYDAPFQPAYPFPAATAIRLGFDAAGMDPGTVKEFSAGGAQVRPVGELKISAK
jgi:hypothetical protein